MSRLIPLLVITVPFTFASAWAASGSVLTLDSYLSQVRSNHQGVLGARETGAGAIDQARESELVDTPSLFANMQLQTDSSIPSLPLFTYDKLITNSYSLGVSENFDFGLQTKLEYDVIYFDYVNVLLPAGFGLPAGLTNLHWHQSSPKLTLTEPIWGGGFGRSTRAQEELTLAQTEATRYGADFQTRQALVEAENAYWAVAIARLGVEVTRDALARAERILAWNTRRARLSLGDSADVLQSQALVEQRKLDLQSSLDDERVSSQAFNSSRSQGSSEVPEQLQRPDPDLVAHLPTPARGELRDDVKAARAQTAAMDAQARLSIEKDQPTLNLFGSFALNGRAYDIDQALGDPFAAGRPTETVGVQLNLPLDFGAARAGRAGWARSQAGADLAYRRKLFEQDASWKDLGERLGEARRRLGLAESIEGAQKSKLDYERLRLERGRSTTYQVLLFEQDFATAQITRVHTEGEILSLIAQMKLFGDTQP